MSGLLWKYFLENDVARFRELLEGAHYVASQRNRGINVGLGIGSPGSLGTSPTLAVKTPRKSDGHLGTSGQVSLTRADINRRDVFGRTLLHLAASSTSENAFAFASALLEQPLTDIYIQDTESGWTALHRALYHGNVSIARAILNRDAHDTLGPGAAGFVLTSMGLIKIKDREGNGPLDLFANTVESDRHGMSAAHVSSGSGSSEDDEDRFPDETTQHDVEGMPDVTTSAAINLRGDEVFTFGSNKNVTLGFGDEDDRQYPERITLKRPEHLLQRFYAKHLETHAKGKNSIESSVGDLSCSQSLHLPSDSLPSIIRNKPIVIQDVYMSKFSTAVLTTDPEANLYMCGHGQSGRLGLGDERTRFQFVCVESGTLAGRRIKMVALGQNHSLAISEEGDVFSWGSNGFGQLGFDLGKKDFRDDDPVQTLPRQIFGPLKREIIIGIAASRIHSVAHTATSLYTFGKNEGQLGIVDSDARSLEMQIIPRRVAASLFSANIGSVAAIDRATICLLETHDVYVFANYGYAKLSFALDMFSSPFSQQSFTATRYESTPNRISKITAGGNTICAMSSAGEVFTITVNQPTELTQNVSASTTNPAKIRGALSQPHRIWDLRKGHMAARDVGVDQDGSIILTTDAGSVWRRVKRAKIATAGPQGDQYRAKDYKFLRIPGLTRAIAVRSSAYGAYAAVRKDCTVTRTQIEVEGTLLWTDLFKLLPFKQMAEAGDDSGDETLASAFGNKQAILANVMRQVIGPKNAEEEVQDIISRATPDLPYNMMIRAAGSEVAIPVHSFMLAGRSRVIRQGLRELHDEGFWSIPELLTIETNDNGKPTLVLHGADFLTVFNLVFYLYTDLLIEFWILARRYPKLAFRYRSIRSEMLKLATALEMTELERAVRLQTAVKATMDVDLESAFMDERFFEDGDVLVQLSDTDLLVHSGVVCRRCPFFEGLFIGRAGGQWLNDRRGNEVVNVDLKHIESTHFKMALRHIYADTGEELFNGVAVNNVDEFLDVVIAVMGVANELMLDRLSQICQKVVGQYVTVRNISQLLNAISPCSVAEFKDKGLEYICLNLEALIVHGLINELDEDLLFELDDVVRVVQLRFSEVTRSGIIEDSLHDAHPELAAAVEAERQAKIDFMMLHTKHFAADRAGTFSSERFKEDYETSGGRQHRVKPRSSTSPVLPSSPMLNRKKSAGEFMFAMDEDGDELTPLDPSASRHHRRTSFKGAASGPPNVDDHQWYDNRGKKLSSPSQSISSSARKTPFGSPNMEPPSLSTRPEVGSSPWGKSPLTTKLDMKDIMAQTSSSRTSGISLALSAQNESRPKLRETQASGSFHSKQSQKERKKQQQAKVQQSNSAPTLPTEAAASSAPTESKQANPWQTIQRPKAAPKDPLKTSSPSPSPVVNRSVTAPSLTMRQTIAGSGSSGKLKATEATSLQHANTSGSPSLPQTQSKAQNASPSVQRLSAAPVIQSIRHIPRPRAAEPTTGLSMADILSQQQAEKTAIREATTSKRSLQEIQQEQEFQEWWDMESRKVMEEERKKEVQVRRDERGVRGGKGKGKRGRGGGNNASSSASGETKDRGSGSGSGSTGRSAHRGEKGPSRGRGTRNQKGKAIGSDA